MIQSVPITDTPSPSIPPRYHICQETNATCSILCNATNPCKNLRIDASLAQILNLTCIAPQICQDLQVIAGPKAGANIHCSYDYSCKYAVFNLSSTAGFVNLECMQEDYGGADWSCNQAKLIADTVSNVNVHCGYLNCVGMDFHIQYVETAIFVMKWGGAKDANIYGNNIQNELKIFCMLSYACKNTNIYAQGMTHSEAILNITCLETDACLYTQIYCPTEDGYCDINCNDPSYPCREMDIFIEDRDYDFDLYCDGTYACKYNRVHCENDGNSTKLSFSAEPLLGLECADDKCCPPSFETLCEPNVNCNVCIITKTKKKDFFFPSYFFPFS